MGHDEYVVCAQEEQVKHTNMRMPSMSPFQLSTRSRSNFSAWVRHMDHISAELSTVGVESAVIGGASSVAGEFGKIRQPISRNVRLRYLLGCEISSQGWDLSRGRSCENEAWSMLRTRRTRRTSLRRHLKGSRTLECPRDHHHRAVLYKVLYVSVN